MARAIDMFERWGTERICVASACDWGPSLPDAVPHFALAMRRRGHDQTLIDRVIFDNPCDFLGQSPNFQVGTSRREGVRAAEKPMSESDASVGSGAAAA